MTGHWARIDSGADVPRVARSRAGRRPRPQQRTVPLSSSAQVWLAAGADRDGLAAGAEVDRADRAGRLVVADVASCCRSRAGRCRRAPAAHRAVVEQRAGVAAAGGDRDRRAPGAEVDRADRAGRLVVADRRRVAVAELAAGADAPAAHRAVVEQRAGVAAAGARSRPPCARRRGRPAPTAAGVSLSPIVVRVAVAELAVERRGPSSARCRCRGARRCGCRRR